MQFRVYVPFDLRMRDRFLLHRPTTTRGTIPRRRIHRIARDGQMLLQALRREYAVVARQNTGNNGFGRESSSLFQG